ncbi:hypothetical protein AB0G73_06685 [Streptomyces sp. NPDC020719]
MRWTRGWLVVAVPVEAGVAVVVLAVPMPGAAPVELAVPVPVAAEAPVSV